MDWVLVAWFGFLIASAIDDLRVDESIRGKHGIRRILLFPFFALGIWLSWKGAIVGGFYGYTLYKARKVNRGDILFLSSLAGGTYNYLPHPLITFVVIATAGMMVMFWRAGRIKEPQPVTPYLTVAFLIIMAIVGVIS